MPEKAIELQQRPSWPRLCWLAIRPKTLWLSMAPVIVGSALAWGEGHPAHWPAFLVAVCAALLIQIGTNLYNDAADYERGNDRGDRLGPPRITAAGWVSPRQVKSAAWACFTLAFTLGIYLATRGGWPIVAIGLLSLVCGWAYSGGPRPLSYTPWGEFFVWAFFGLFAVFGSYWLQAHAVNASALLAGAALGFPAAAVLLVNNVRDLAADMKAGRRTLASVLGEDKSRRLYALFMIAPFASLPLLALENASVGLAFLALPTAVRLARRMRSSQGAALNPLLAATVRQQSFFAILLALGSLL
ncbi:MAG: 1,4-dihydroxy-2-naphthoate polyprenyltransferase [Rhodocyclaceae bacterium]|nr:1,4-dihydroxy-2-naphthoate polyprenyltransferase [Rhodocyclaceae bacterium]